MARCPEVLHGFTAAAGLGKTMLAIAIATKLVQLGFAARFLTAQELAARLGRATTARGR